jgi:hypothetical protein
MHGEISSPRIFNFFVYGENVKSTHWLEAHG